MKKLVAIVAALSCVCIAVGVKAMAISSAVDPYILVPGNGELAGTVSVAPATYMKNSNGKVQRSSVAAAPTTSAVVLTAGQSLISNSSLGSYATVNAGSDNFNIYDGGIYGCTNPVLGTNDGGSLTNSANCQIADQLITNGVYTRVIIASITVGGSACADWDTGGQVAQRVSVAMRRLATLGLTPATGWTGGFWIVLHGGESENIQATPRATYAACIRSLAANFVTAGATSVVGRSRFLVPTESIVSNVASATVTGAQADAVASGCASCIQGANIDSLTGATNRQADGLHLTQAGASSMATLDMTVITNCKNTSC